MRLAIFAAVVCALGSSLRADIYTASNYVTFPMDGNYDWFQNGVFAANPGAGLPNPGIIAGQSEPASTFLLQPYTGNNVLLIKSPSPVDNGVQTGTMTFATPTPALSLAARPRRRDMARTPSTASSISPTGRRIFPSPSFHPTGSCPGTARW